MFLKWLFIGPVLLPGHNQCYYYDEGLLGNVVPPEGASLPKLHGIPKYHGEEDPIRYEQESHWCTCGH